MRNSKVHCLLSVFNLFVMSAKFTFVFMAGMNGGCDTARGCFADALLHSSKTNHHEHATEPRQLHKDGPAAWGAVIGTFPRLCHGVSNRYYVLICDPYFVAFVLSQGVRHCWRIVY